MAEDTGQEAARGVEEECEVEETEEDRPAGCEEQEPRAVAHVDGEVVVAEIKPAHEPGGIRELWTTMRT